MFNLLINKHLKISILLIILINLIRLSSTLHVDVDGGYHVEIGIESATDPGEGYIDYLKSQIESLSNLIHASTDKQFYLKSAKIIIPSNWASVADVAESQSFATSDIKISDDYRIPDVIRPTQCGLPGNEVRLPVRFFEDSTNELYKTKDKALLHLWAQYRWGVFEESGFPGNSRFPYFYQESDTSAFEVNTCTNTALQGSFLFPNGTDCTAIDEKFLPYSECRFVPDITSNTDVHTSLMNSFYWIESMNSFCTEESHRSHLPNRQNVFCEYKSIMEVLKSSPDWMKVSEPIAEPIAPTFSVVKTSAKPLLYFLIDARNVPIPDEHIVTIKESIKTLFDPTFGSAIASDILTAMATFPPRSGVEGAYEEIIPWGLSSEERYEGFRGAIDETISRGEAGNGLFGTAIKAIAESIKAREHKAGAYMFVVKTAPTTNFDLMPLEEDVLSTLNSQKIKLYALELSTNTMDAALNLKNLATANGCQWFTPGCLYSILGTAQFARLKQMLSQFVTELNYPTPSLISPNIIFKSVVSPSSLTDIKVVTPDAPVQLRLTSNVELTEVKFSSSSGDLAVNETKEWNESFGRGRRVTYTGTQATASSGDVFSVSFTCAGDIPIDQCKGLLILSTDNSNNQELSVTVSTSAIDNIYDASGKMELAVFVQLEQAGEPIISLQDSGILEASATLCLENDQTNCWIIPLSDNGAGFPDLLSNDGILSGAFVPTLDGDYTIWVTVSFEKRGQALTRTNRMLRAERSIDQTLFPCSVHNGIYVDCVGVDPADSFQLVADLKGTVTITGSDTPREQAVTRIMDLRVIYAVGQTIILTWTSPSIFLPGEIAKAEKYDVRYCPTMDEIIQDFASCTSFNLDIEPAQPGQTETLELTLTESITYYIGIQSTYDESKMSPVSNIVSQQPNTNEITTTEFPLSTTTGAPTTEGSTTKLPTTTTTTTTTTPTTTSTTTSSPPVTDPTDTSTAQTGSTEATTVPSTEPQTSPIASTDVSTDEPSSTSESTNTETDGTSTSEDTTTTSEDTTITLRTTEETTRRPTTLIPPIITEKPEYFFKKQAVYITAGAIALVAVGALSGAIGYLCWKRQLIMKANSRKVA